MESLEATSEMAKDIGLRCSLAEQLRGNAYVGKDMRTSFHAIDAMQNCAEAVKDFRLRTVFSEMLGCMVFTAILDQQIATIGVTIPAGGTLVIDSEHFEVYLNGQEILHLQQGDWITLNRELVDLAIDSGTGGNLRGTILYQERFL